MRSAVSADGSCAASDSPSNTHPWGQLSVSGLNRKSPKPNSKRYVDAEHTDNLGGKDLWWLYPQTCSVCINLYPLRPDEPTTLGCLGLRSRTCTDQKAADMYEGLSTHAFMVDGWMNGWMDVCICMCMRMCICMYIYIYIHIHIYIYMHMQVSVCVYVCGMCMFEYSWYVVRGPAHSAPRVSAVAHS